MKSSSEAAIRPRAARRGLKFSRIQLAWKRPPETRDCPYSLTDAQGVTHAFRTLAEVAEFLDRFDRGEV